ncbi:hypothetical protein STCU_01098 [Strigomonas culicis]|uniref:Seipin n=1 Tax=Strigomonas culicis TaxID=28005 RepID=S9UEX5_9TRYP|nr:hypothetical protein STCU_04589 [Strigomonas culicis]EPY35576.1 hypothetical protein STCU_01098 [Strigomonas culicis]|eukprot:EPY29372.1 hypothetical protein STCU_04589 [Strigomonas culicis]
MPSLHDTLKACTAHVRQLFEKSSVVLMRCVTTEGAKTLVVLSSWTDKGMRMVAKSVAVYLVACVLLFWYLCLMGVCFLCAMATAGVIRHYYLSGAPGNQVVPLSFSALPFLTETWSSGTVAAAFHPAAALDDVAAGRYLTTHSDSTFVGRAAGLQMSLVEQYVNNLIGTSAMAIPQAKERDAITSTGEIDATALFHHGSPMFNALGDYYGEMQIVLAKEAMGRHGQLIVDTKVLYAHVADVAQPPHTWRVLFKTTQTASVLTGTRPPTSLLDTVKGFYLWGLRLVFIVPIKTYGYLSPFFFTIDDAPYPRVDHSTGVSVVLRLYERFAPPVSIQERLRAMNFSIFQKLDDASSTVPLKVSQVSFRSFVELNGIPRLLTRYPISSFVVLTLFFSLVYIGAATVLLALCGGALLYYYYSGQSAAAEEDSEEESERSDYVYPSKKSFTVLPRSHSFSYLDGDNDAEHKDLLGSSQRARSFSSSPLSVAKKKS